MSTSVGVWGSIFEKIDYQKKQTFRDSNEKPDIWLDKFSSTRLG